MLTANVYPIGDRSMPNRAFNREEIVKNFAAKASKDRNQANQIAKSRGWRLKGKKDHRVYQLVRFSQNRPIYYQTCNENSAISHGVDLIRNTQPYNLDGQSYIVGIWDAGDVRSNHQEFDTRVTLLDYAGNDSHATHVCGTIAASGIDSDSLGMAPGVSINSFDWNLAESEMADWAMSYFDEPSKIYVSNHSYGVGCGWEMGDYSGNEGDAPHWFGQWGDGKCRDFGRYGEGAPQYDSICYLAPYYLPFWAAGNDRNDSPPTESTMFYYFDGYWKSKQYDGSSDPDGDGVLGFDTIQPGSTAKNIMTVGSVNDAVTSGQRDISKALMSSYSGWGPTDDGRIKPDIVCNGQSLYSSTASSDSSYGYYSGTSMATPSASGAAILLVEYYKRLFPGQAMLSSTLKGLILHTADDIGNPGPDYSFGWGLMNAKSACDHILAQHDRPDCKFITEGFLDQQQGQESYSFFWDGSSSIQVTLCWTDPPATEITGLDNSSPRLVNDLDITVNAPDGLTTYHPYILNPSSPASDAVVGDNTIDNVEQAYISSPPGEGIYVVNVTYKGVLTDSQQRYSLFISGQSDQPVRAVDHFRWTAMDAVYDVNVPFDVIIEAVDESGFTVADFNEPVELTGLTGADSFNVEVGSGVTPEEYPISVYYKRSRTQSIYLAEELGTSGVIEGLALYVNELPGLTRDNWTIRLKHTPLNQYSSAQWDSSDWTVVYNNDEPPGSVGWQYYQFDEPFEYDGSSNLMVDFSFYNKSYSNTRGNVYRKDTQAARSLGFEIDNSSAGVPTDWVSSSPGCNMFQWVPNIEFKIADSKVTVAIDPNQAGSFVDGVWAGHVTVLEDIPEMFLRAADDSSHIGDSNHFQVLPLSLPVLGSPDPNDDDVDVAIETSLSWQDTSQSVCASSYDVYLATEDPPTTLISSGTDQNTFNPKLFCSKTYYWQVVAHNCHGTISGPVWSFSTESLASDFDNSCFVDIKDFKILASFWLTSNTLTDIEPQIGDGVVDILDLAVFMQDWLSGIVDK